MSDSYRAPYRQSDPPPQRTKIYSVALERRTQVYIDVEAADEEEAKRLAEQHIETFYRQGVVAETVVGSAHVIYHDVEEYKRNQEKLKTQIERNRSMGIKR